MKRVEFTDDEFQALAMLIDAGIKALGLQAIRGAAIVVSKLENAKEVELEPVKKAKAS